MTKHLTPILLAALSGAVLLPSVAAAQQGEVLAPSLSSEAPDAGKAFPLMFSTGLSNSVGSGVFGTGFAARPMWNSSIPLRLSYRLPEIDLLPRMTLSAGTGVGVQWLSNYDVGTADRLPRVGDLSFSLSMGNLLSKPLVNDGDVGSKWTRLRLTSGVGVRLPISIFSRQQNKAATGSAQVNLGWSLPEDVFFDGEFGGISFGYGVGGWATAFTQSSPTIPCNAPPEFGPGLFGTGDPVKDINNVPLSSPRAAEVLPNGQCRLIGRQGVAGVSQNLSASWSLKRHSVGISLGMGTFFLRPLSAGGDEFTSPNAIKQSFGESSTGSIGYSYSIPDEALGLPFWTSSSLSIALSSGQPVFTKDGRSFRFPWWDFVSPSNNFSSMSISYNVSF